MSSKEETGASAVEIQPKAEKQRVIIVMEGGYIKTVEPGDTELDVVIVDYDIEFADPETIIEVPQINDGEIISYESATCYEPPVVKEPIFRGIVLEAFDKLELECVG